MESSIEKIIFKFFDNHASLSELDFLIQWISNEKNYLQYQEYIAINNLTNIALNNKDQEKIIQEINSRIISDKNKKIRKKIYKYFGVAAIAICFFSTIMFLDFLKNDTESLKIIDPSKISLTTSDGEIIDLENLDDQQTKINKNTLVNQNANTLYYKNDPTSKEIKYNELKVPYGKVFNIELSDGTLVYLNSGTTLRFPINFLQGLDREVFIEGEAFFEVTKSKLSQFKVSSNNTSVNVYGTKFNFKHFPEDNFSEVILTEGSLGVSKTSFENDEEITIIKPGEKAKVLFDEDKIERSRVNAKLYTSWINGRVAFRNESLPNLIQKLERIYNVIIINNNNDITDKKFSATILYKEESINEVLSYLSQVYGLEYQILDNKILIK
tara:strand:- start:1090 stop:2238 length:1149 start_codon:yes stop_codon:yes gene_type:complete